MRIALLTEGTRPTARRSGGGRCGRLTDAPVEYGFGHRGPAGLGRAEQLPVRAVAACGVSWLVGVPGARPGGARAGGGGAVTGPAEAV